MGPADLDAACAVSAGAFGRGLDEEPFGRRWRHRVAHPLRTDPEGCFVAERDGETVGVAQTIVRGGLWCLSLLTVAPERQDAGIGWSLLEAALTYGSRCEAGLIVSSNDSRALRLYAGCGFSLRPTLTATGSLRRGELPPRHPAIWQAGIVELPELAPIAHAVRGAAQSEELEQMLASGSGLLRLGDRGYAVFDSQSQEVSLVVALDEEAASALLCAALELAGEQPSLRWITAGQDWAIEVAVRAGLSLSAYGALCVRGDVGPLRPFIPSGSFA